MKWTLRVHAGLAMRPRGALATRLPRGGMGVGRPIRLRALDHARRHGPGYASERAWLYAST